MSVPPHILKIKRKRDDDAPVTFLQFDDGAKRHRSDSNWIYRRRDALPHSPTVGSSRDARPVIHVAGDAPNPHKKPSHASAVNAQNPRRFHISRSMLKNEGDLDPNRPRISKRARKGPAIFVERTRKKITPKSPMDRRVISSTAVIPTQSQTSSAQSSKPEEGQTTKNLKKPGTTSRVRADKNGPARTPLPPTMRRPHEEEMSKIADSMNEWMINEIGANLHSIEQERQQSQSTSPFRPKAPAQRFRDRHPGEALPSAASQVDVNDGAMDVDNTVEDEASDEEGDWVYEEYVRVPYDGNVQKDLIPSDVGVLVLDGEEASALFYGPENDSDDDFVEDDEDENAENHYTADYPEDEVDSEDEFGRQAYLYRTRNASDDEEFDNEGYESSDEMVLDDNDDHEATMARIKAYMKRHAARE
ncbi:transcription factor iwr1 domain-containing protein [Sarocladium implicatum]|nr:transcription factor iwr1 domain-containing protein [Sarocladium implicatum]